MNTKHLDEELQTTIIIRILDEHNVGFIELNQKFLLALILKVKKNYATQKSTNFWSYRNRHKINNSI